jgi:hypothetical protein
VVLRAAFGLPMTESERAAFKNVAGDRAPPSRRVRELWCILGRRSGKSRMAGALAVFIACLTDARSRLAAGEQGYVLVLAPSLNQAKIIQGYCQGFIEASPLLRSQLERADPNRDQAARGCHHCDAPGQLSHRERPHAARLHRR